MLPLHVYTDAPILQPAPRYPDQPLRVVVLIRRNEQHGYSTDGIVWVPNEPALGPQQHDYVNTLLAGDPQRDRLTRGLDSIALAAARGPVNLGVIADCDENLLSSSSHDDPRSRPLCTTLLHAASAHQPVDLVIVPHHDDEPANPELLEQFMRIAQYANVPMLVGVPTDAMRTLRENSIFQNSRLRDHAGWIALIAGDVWSTLDPPVLAGPVSAAFALASAVITSMTRNDLPNFIGRTTGGKVERFRCLSDSPTAAPVFVDDTWIEYAAAGFVPLRVDADGSLFFPAAPMVRHHGPLEREIPLPNRTVVNDAWAQAHADQLPWRILLARMLSVLRETRDELLLGKPNASAAEIRTEMELVLGTYLATHGAVISPPVRKSRPFSDRSRVFIENTADGDFVGLTLYPHRASTTREIFLVFFALLARACPGSGCVLDIGDDVPRINR